MMLATTTLAHRLDENWALVIISPQSNETALLRSTPARRKAGGGRSPIGTSAGARLAQAAAAVRACECRACDAADGRSRVEPAQSALLSVARGLPGKRARPLRGAGGAVQRDGQPYPPGRRGRLQRGALTRH